MRTGSRSMEIISRIRARIFREILMFIGARDSNIASLECGEMKSEIQFTRGVKYSSIQTIESIHARDQLLQVHSFGERFIYCVEDVILDSATGILFTNKGKIIEESSSWPKSSILLNSIPKPYFKGLAKPDGSGRTFINLPSNGFYHWLLEDLGPFIFAMHQTNPSLVLLYENAPPYVRTFLPMIKTEVLEVPRFVHLDRYTFTSKGPDTGWPHGNDIATLRAFYKPHFREQEKGKKIYISRVDSRRSPSFERELVSRLTDQGWEVLHTERMSLAEQVEAISKASTLCGVHGAGLGGMIWMNAESQVIELGPSRFVPCFSRMSQICGIRYHRIAFDESSPRTASEISSEIDKAIRLAGS